MPEYGKALLNFTLAAATLFLTAVLWHQPLVLIALLIVTGATIFRIRPSRTSVVVYVTAFAFGPAAEAMAIYTGAWTYASDNVLGFPVWLPFVWGNAALFIYNTAELWKSLFLQSTSRANAADRVADGPRTTAPPHRPYGEDASVSSPEQTLGPSR
jgi:hypothetical protein